MVKRNELILMKRDLIQEETCNGIFFATSGITANLTQSTPELYTASFVSMDHMLLTRAQEIPW